ncbi:MAG: hypothetical protein NC078_07025 [Ruminococcus sp.]|nr:hypothetical protein [Ruminococcus sp.]
MQIIKIKDSRYDEYEELLFKRDALKKEAHNYLVLYINEFGELTEAVFRKKIDCICRKKAIAFCGIFVNKGERINIEELNIYVKEQTADYQRQLDEMIKDNESCKDLKEIPEAAVLKVKQIYRRIAKLIHPDINPATDNDPVFLELWTRIDAAYRANDLKEMEELEMLVMSALKKPGNEDIQIEIPDIAEKIESLKIEIEKIRSADPYQYKFILESPELRLERRRELEAELREYTEYEKELEKILWEITAKNGVEVTWDMN